MPQAAPFQPPQNIFGDGPAAEFLNQVFATYARNPRHNNLAVGDLRYHEEMNNARLQKRYREGIREGFARGRKEASKSLGSLRSSTIDGEPTPLMQAVLKGSAGSITLLRQGDHIDLDELSYESDSRGPNVYRSSPLCAAIRHNHLDVVMKLLKFGVRIQQREPSGSNALFAAAQAGANEIIRILFRDHNRAMRSLMTDRYYTEPYRDYDAICVAIYHRKTSTADLLFEKYREAGVGFGFYDASLQLACRKGNFSFVQNLIDAHINVNSQDDTSRSTPLHSAIKGKQQQIIYLLMDHNANPELADSEGLTPLMFAIKEHAPASADEREALNMIQLLHNHYGGRLDVNVALAYAVKNNHQRCVEELLSRGADSNCVPARDTNLRPPIQEALDPPKLDIAKILFRKGARLADPTAAIERAIQRAQVPVLQCILGQKTYKSALKNWPRNRKGPIHIAIDHDKSNLIPFLLEHEADIEFHATEGDDGNYRPIHHAANKLDLLAVSELLGTRNKPKLDEKTTRNTCQNCSDRRRAWGDDAEGMYPRCYLENQRMEVADNPQRRRDLEVIDDLIKESGGSRPPRHRSNNVATQTQIPIRAGGLCRRWRRPPRAQAQAQVPPPPPPPPYRPPFP